MTKKIGDKDLVDIAGAGGVNLQENADTGGGSPKPYTPPDPDEVSNPVEDDPIQGSGSGSGNGNVSQG